MILYYGSNKVVERPIYNFGNKFNDYGVGFYLTPDKDMARLWASKFPDGGYLITYTVDIEGLKVLNLNNKSKDDILTWITLLLNHRFNITELEDYKDIISVLNKHYYVNTNDYDVIVGYRADDAYFRYSKDFINGSLSLESLSEAIMIGKLGIQYVLKSQNAFENISFVSYENVDHSNEYELFRNKSLDEYHNIKKTDAFSGTRIVDIIRGLL